MIISNPRTAKPCASTLKENTMQQQNLFTQPKAKRQISKEGLENIKSMKIASMLKQKTLTELLGVLAGMGCEYFVRDADGNEHSHGESLRVKVKPVKHTRKRNLKYQFGELTAYVRPYIDALQPGQNVVIPGGKYQAIELSSSTSSYANRIFGKGASLTAINEDTNTVEVLRLS
jgi:hypothetical protein